MVYIIQVSCYSAILFGVYLFFIKGVKAYSLARIYLLLCACLPLLLPLVKATVGTSSGGGMAGVMLPMVNFAARVHMRGDTSVWYIIYAFITTVLFMFAAIQYAACLRFLHRFPYRQINGAKLISGCGKGPGSFGNYIFFPSNDLQDEAFRHELAHVALKHTADVLLLQLLCCIFWPNIVLYLILRELRAIHEFQADELAVEDNKGEYARLLLSGIFQTTKFPLSNTFFNHPIKRRIIMLQKKPLSRANMRATVVRTAIATTFVLVSLVYLQSCTRQQEPIVKASSSVPVLAAKEHIPIAGTELPKFMAENLVYPTQAMNDKIEGRVVVGFTVNEQGETENAIIKTVEVSGLAETAVAVSKEGKTLDPAVKNTYGKSFEEEALRVVKLLPRWQPAMKDGKAVATELCLPIAFKLQ
jgi:TonB family protein